MIPYVERNRHEPHKDAVLSVVLSSIIACMIQAVPKVDKREINRPNCVNSGARKFKSPVKTI
jgi:hypothetical protein